MIEATGRDTYHIYRMQFLDNGKVKAKIIKVNNCKEYDTITYDTHEEGLFQLKRANTCYSYEKRIKEVEKELKNL